MIVGYWGGGAPREPGPGQENGATGKLSQRSAALTARQVGQLTGKITGPLGAGVQVRAALKQSGYAANFLSPQSASWGLFTLLTVL